MASSAVLLQELPLQETPNRKSKHVPILPNVNIANC